MKAAVIFGSASDRAVMEKAAAVLRDFGVEYTSHVLSAHRAPELLAETVAALERDGTEVIIAGAGLAAHLPGVIASRTVLPVIGVPVAAANGGGLGGLDALLSMAQMPRPVPVAVVGLDNAANAAYLAVEILGVKYPELRKRLEDFRTNMKSDLAKNSGGGL